MLNLYILYTYMNKFILILICFLALQFLFIFLNSYQFYLEWFQYLNFIFTISLHSIIFPSRRHLAIIKRFAVCWIFQFVPTETPAVGSKSNKMLNRNRKVQYFYNFRINWKRNLLEFNQFRCRIDLEMSGVDLLVTRWLLN